jgi:acetylornithine deacetylase/succinyl-diaminopimelate desuccinylase-like protein
VAYLLRRHLDEHGFEDIQMRILSGEHPGKSDPGAEVIQAAIAAAREVYQTEPVVYPLMAGTGPVWPIAVAHGTPLVNLGASYPGAKVHAPNEHIVLDNYFRAMQTMGRFINNFGEG